MQSRRLVKSSRLAIVLLFLGVVSVAVTVGGAWLYFRPEPLPPAPKETPPPKPVPLVLTAGNDLNVGRLITASDLLWSPVNDGSVLSSHMLKGQTEESQVVGSVVRRRIFKGRPLSWSAIVRPGEHGFLAAALRPDHRAVTITVDSATSQAALIYPGDHVDVILTAQIREGNGREQTVTATILENIRVVAVNRQVESSVGGSKGGVFGGGRSRNATNTVTLELLPTEAERLIVAKSKGAISLAMRSLTDVRRREDRTPTAFESLLPVATEPEPAPVAEQISEPEAKPVLKEPTSIRVQIFRGGKKEEVTVTR